MAGIEELLHGHALVDRYRIEEVIGRGGMGAVYRGVDERLGRQVAVKVITGPASDPAEREELRARFHREARVAAGIHHPNVVTVYDFGLDPALGLDFLIMELLHGDDLATRLARSGPPPLATSLRIVRETARGLAAGHRAGLIHRDVKPGNIFLEEDEFGELRVRVVDFGIARIMEGQDATRITQFGRVPLSPAYASPEQLRAERNLTPASDVFSLGVIAYELLTGDRLFARDGADRLAPGIAQPVPSLRTRNSAVSPEVEAVLLRALAWEPDARYPNAGAFVEALDAASRVVVDAPPPAAVAVVSPPKGDEQVPAETEDEQVPAEPVGAPPAPAQPTLADPHLPTVVLPRQPTPATAAPIPPAPVRRAPQRPRPRRHAKRRRTPLARREVRVLLALLLLGGAGAAAWAMLGGGGDERGRAAVPPDTAAVPETTQVAISDPAEVQEIPEPTPAPASVPEPAPAPRTESSPAAAAPAPPTERPSPESPREAEPPSSPPEARAPAASPPREAPTTAPTPPARAAEAPAAEGSAARINVEGVRVFGQGDLRGAREQFRRATELAPRNAEYRNNYGWALFRLGEVAAAERELEETIRLNPRRDIAHANLGEVRLARGDTAAAIAAYERFLELNTDPSRRAIAERKLRSLRQ